MDATALRWVLAIIGVIIIVGVYLYTLYQNKLRRRAAIKTFTDEELEHESGYIEDETLRKELSSINTMLDQDVLDNEILDKEISKIKIHPGPDSGNNIIVDKKSDIHLPQSLHEIPSENLVAHVLKHTDGRVLTGAELNNAFEHVGLEQNGEGFFELKEKSASGLKFMDITASGSFTEINDAQFSTYGLVCYFDLELCEQPEVCYELMLKKIDELVRILDLKVYKENLQLLTLQHVTEMRKRLMGNK